MTRQTTAALVALFIGTVAHSQPADQPLTFEVASVKLLPSTFPPTELSTLPHRNGGRIHWIANRLLLVRYAYQMQGWKIAGLATDDSIYVIDAKIAESVADDQLRLIRGTRKQTEARMIVAPYPPVNWSVSITESNGYPRRTLRS